MSWDELEQMAQPVGMREDEQRLLADFRITFGTEEGQRVLAYLRADTIEKPNIVNYAHDGQAMANLSFVREGENNLYRKIEAMIKKGKRNHD